MALFQTNMVASYAKHTLSSPVNTTPNTPPNYILYVGIAPQFSDRHWTSLLKNFQGFEVCKFFANYGLAQFTCVKTATQALDELSTTTNLTITYSKMKTIDHLNTGII